MNPKMLYKGFRIPTRSAQLYPLCLALFSFVLKLENPDSLFRCQCNRCLSPILSRCFWSSQWVGTLLLLGKGGLRNDRSFQTLCICSQGARHCFKAEPVHRSMCYYLLFIDNIPYASQKLLSEKKLQGIIFTNNQKAPNPAGCVSVGKRMEGKGSQRVQLPRESHPRVYPWQLSIPRQAPRTGKTPRSRGEKGDGMFIAQPRNKWEPLQRCIIQQLQLFVFSDTPCKQLSLQSNIIKLSFFFLFSWYCTLTGQIKGKIVQSLVIKKTAANY